MDKVISIISTYSALLPVIAGIFAFGKSEIAYRLLIAFIVYGFITDMVIWRLSESGYNEAWRSAAFIYCLIESLFFTWFIQKTGTHLFLTMGIKICYIMFPLMWFFMHIGINTFTWLKDTYNSQFVTTYQITIAIFSAYSIFYLSKKGGKVFYNPLFWFLAAILFYCFFTFIPASFLFTTQKKDIWFLHNLFNVVTMLMFALGFLIITRKNKTPVVST